MPERRTPLFDYHVRHAEMVRGGGDFLFPLAYTNPVEEHLNTRRNVGMQDLSTMGEVDIKGPGAERLINRLLVNEVRDMLPGQVRYSTMCNQNGGIVDDITVYKFHDEHFMIVTSSAPRKKSARWIAEHAVGMSAYVTDLTGAIALISVQGPRSRDLLTAVVNPQSPISNLQSSISDLKFFHFTGAMINDTQVLISRSGYTGELGYELYVPSEEALSVWEFLLQRGRDFGLRPYGTAAMQSLRIEKAFPLAGPDIPDDESRTPFHVGLDRWIRFDKPDFVGREALLRTQEMGITERWVGLHVESEIAPRAGAAVMAVSEVAPQRRVRKSGARAGEAIVPLSSGAQVGAVTSAARGHSVGKMLALAYVQTTHAFPGCQLMVDVEGEPRPARVVPIPFFDPQGIRMRARSA
ncbi:MAG: aminomethyltransferase family protein [Anaerolineae bacterium]|nr:aminomethyltransferase family protein [Candidatus Roseilinea sp.]MDW8451515.1 aminomethyltransferase family protein [Anaerolineae bacterium]